MKTLINWLKERAVSSLKSETTAYRQKSFTKAYYVALEDIYPAIYKTLEAVLTLSPVYTEMLTICSEEDPSLKMSTPEEECDFTQGGELHIVYHNLYEMLERHLETTYKAWYQEYRERTQPTITKLKMKTHHALLTRLNERQQEFRKMSLEDGYVEIYEMISDVIENFLDDMRLDYHTIIENCRDEDINLITKEPTTDCSIEEGDWKHRAYHNLYDMLREHLNQSFEEWYKE